MLGVTPIKGGAPASLLRLHLKATALGRDHLKLPRKDGSLANIVAATVALERWNQQAKNAAEKVRRTLTQ